MLNSVQVKCTRCKTVFRERARRMQSGYSRQCPCCEVVLFFEEDFERHQHEASDAVGAPDAA